MDGQIVFDEFLEPGTQASITNEDFAKQRKIKLTPKTFSLFKRAVSKTIHFYREEKYNSVYDAISNIDDLSSKSAEYLLNKLQKIGVKLIKSDYKTQRYECVQKAKPIKLGKKFVTRIKDRIASHFSKLAMRDAVNEAKELYSESIDKIVNNPQDSYSEIERMRDYTNYSPLSGNIRNYPEEVVDDKKIGENVLDENTENNSLGENIKSDVKSLDNNNEIGNGLNNNKSSSTNDSSDYKAKMQEFRDLLGNVATNKAAAMPPGLPPKPTAMALGPAGGMVDSIGEQKTDVIQSESKDGVDIDARVNEINDDILQKETRISELLEQIEELKKQIESLRNELNDLIAKKNKEPEIDQNQSEADRLVNFVRNMKQDGFTNDEIIIQINPQTREESKNLWFALGKVDGEMTAEKNSGKTI